MTICPHTIRVIEDWAGKKVLHNTAKSTTGNARGASGFGFDFPAPIGSPGLGKSLKNGNGSHSASKAAAKKREGAQTPLPPGEQDEPDSPTAAQAMRSKFDSPGSLSIPHPKYMRANTQHLFQRRQKDVQRATVPTNKSPVCVRVLSNETPFGSDLHDPHSPMNIVNDSILPERFIRER